MRYLLPVVCMLLFFTSCKKENFNNNIIGKWKLSEKMDAYVNGGQFTWENVPAEHQMEVQFDTNGSYHEKRPNGTDFTLCMGSFHLLSETELEINTPCLVQPYFVSVSVQNDILEITHIVREGKIIEKYIKTP